MNSFSLEKSDASCERDMSAAIQQFSTKKRFSHKPPYDPVFAERVPLLNAFNLALSNYRISVGYDSTKLGILRSLLYPLPAFHAAECGVFKGNSLVACASIARDHGVNFRFWGLDSFDGFPALSEIDKQLSPLNAPYLNQKLFSDTSLDKVRKLLNDAGFDKQIALIPGFSVKHCPS